MNPYRLTIALVALVAIGASSVFALEVPSSATLYEPIVVKHESGTEVQILPWGTQLPQFLDAKFVKRFEDHTIFCAPAGAYLVSGDGELKIVIIQDAAPPVPPPGPNPGPTPPDPGPTPPQPPPEPDNSIPSDRFDDLARRVDKSADDANLQVDKRKNLAREFLSVHNDMVEFKIKRVTDAADRIKQAETSAGILSDNSWKPTRDIYVQDGVGRSPMSWGEVLDWYKAVGVGLNGGPF